MIKVEFIASCEVTAGDEMTGRESLACENEKMNYAYKYLFKKQKELS